MNVCPICEASLSHHTLYNGKFVPRVYNVSRISLLAPKKRWPKKKPRHRTDFEGDR